MPKSQAFTRIHRDVMQVTAAIPAGRVATSADIGAFLDSAHTVIGLDKLRFRPTRRNTGVTPVPRPG